MVTYYSNYVEETNRSGLRFRKSLDSGEVVEKECSGCLEMKRLEYFDRDKHKFAGRCPRCKVCKRTADKANRKNWYSENREYAINYNMQWRINNPEKARLLKNKNDNARRAKVRKLESSITTSYLENLLTLQSGRCLLSGSQDLNLDHFIPLDAGVIGSVPGNVIYLDSKLNKSKKNRNPFDWIATQCEEVQTAFYCRLVPFLADLNEMSVSEFREYVNACFGEMEEVSL